MPDLMATLAPLVVGASCGLAVFTIAWRGKPIDAATWLARRRNAEPASRARRPALDFETARKRLSRLIDRAGWKESAERVTVFALALAGCMTVVGAMSASLIPAGNAVILGAVGFAGGIGSSAWVLRSAVAGRRRRLAAEMVPLLELFTLELSGGGSALSALDSVTAKVQGELASDIRGLLIGAQVGGANPFETRLMHYSEHLDIPALASFATILGSSREYGTGAGQGVRALAPDLRHAQRRELIAHSRRALNQVLIPAAVGVLLPFLAVVMFPAVTALQRSLH